MLEIKAGPSDLEGASPDDVKVSCFIDGPPDEVAINFMMAAREIFGIFDAESSVNGELFKHYVVQLATNPEAPTWTEPTEDEVVSRHEVKTRRNGGVLH